MRVQKKLLMILVLFVMIGVCGCGAPVSEPIPEIPEGARKVTSIDVTGKTGTLTDTRIEAWSDGYVVLDIRLQSGDIGYIEILNTTDDEVIDVINGPKRKIYDSEVYQYRTRKDYRLNIANSRNLTGSIDVYFVAVFE